MEHLNTHTTDGAQINLDALYKICPSCFTETKDENGELRKVVDFAKLRALLGDNTNDGAPESYDFTWVGKRAAQREAAAPISKTLRPCPEESVDWENTKNLYIEGDNLEVLKLLQNSYMGKVKMIYIDPPYNTGNDFVYHDDFSVSADEYEDASGNVNEAGERFRKNTDSNGRFHSDWCSMMYARLLVARSLLREDGVIFISIDDNEVENLKKICNEIFGERNFISTVIWKKKYGIQNDAKYFSTNHDFILVFCKSIDNYKQGLLPRSEEQNQRYKNPDNDPRGPWKAGDMSVGRITEKDIYEIVTPSGRHVLPPAGNSWRLSKEKYKEYLDDNRIWFGSDGNNVPSIKRFLSEVKDGMTCSTIWEYDEVGHTDKAKKDLKALFDGKALFEYPKSVELIQRMLILASDKDSIIVDFFSGSSTTAHSVFKQNCEDSGNRRFIMIQLPELTDSKDDAYKEGYTNICDIAKERIRRAGAKIKAENPNVDTGFRVFKCDESNYKDVYLNPSAYQQEELDLFLDNIKDDRTDLDLLFDCMLRWGVELSLPMTQTKADGCTIHNVNDGDLVACFDGVITDKVIDAIAEMNPLRIVFRDSSFEEASEKMNLYELFKQKCGWNEQEVKNNVRVI